jgi:hypothetical protein
MEAYPDMMTNSSRELNYSAEMWNMERSAVCADTNSVLSRVAGEQKI